MKSNITYCFLREVFLHRRKHLSSYSHHHIEPVGFGVAVSFVSLPCLLRLPELFCFFSIGRNNHAV